MIRPVGKNILTKMVVRDKIGGIIIPERAQKGQSVEVELEVVAFGEDVKLNIKSGDRIVCSLMNWIPMEGFKDVEKKHGVIKEEHVLGIIM